MGYDKEDSKKALKKVGIFALKTAVVSGAVLGGVAIAVPAIGFGVGGVTAGSLAAAYQSTVLGGTIASGSSFALLQSIGAAGLAAGTKAAVVALSAAGAAVHTVFSKRGKKIKPDESPNPDEEESDEDEVESLKRKWADAKLPENLTITKNLIKK